MRCADVVASLDDTIHGDADPHTAAALRDHLIACERCRTLHRRLGQQRAAMAAASGPVAAPAALRASLIRHLLARQRRRQRWWAMGGALAASLVATLLVLTVGIPGRTPAAFDVLAREAVDDHIRVVLRQRSGASGPSDPEAVRSLMVPVLDFPVPRPRPAAGPFRLEGGRPSYVAGQPVACFYYRAGDRYASLFVVPVERLGPPARPFLEDPRVEDRRSHRLAFWAAQSHAYLLVSDLAGPDLLQLAERLRSS